MLIERDELCSLIPHAGSMCLLDRVEQWDEATIRCASDSHRDRDNPLRRDNQLSAVHLAEYGAQAMAVHGGLLARLHGRQAAPGFLAGLRKLELKAQRIDDIAAQLIVDARQLMGGENGWLYNFQVIADGEPLVSGRVSVLPQPMAS